MIVDYGFSLKGKSHVTMGTCCQDNHKIKRLENGWVIAAIADGVGSAKNSQIGSRIAVDTVVSVCEEFMPWDYNIISIKSMMRTAYNYAFKQILRESKKSGEPIESYDTTLTMAIYDGRRIIYGHSGDGAIIGLNVFGDYIPITKPQKGVDGVTVIPLRAGYTQWKIDTYEEELASVLLMTDGMFDIFCPYLLRDFSTGINKVYVPITSFFGDPISFAGNEKSINQNIARIMTFLEGKEEYDEREFFDVIEGIYKKRVGEKFEDYISVLKKNSYPIVLMQGVQDDKTMVGLINTEVEVENKDTTFYCEPDWQKLQEEWNRKAYPHLYTDKPEMTTNSQVSEKSIGESETAGAAKADKKKITIQKEPLITSEVIPKKSNSSGRTQQALEAYAKTTNPSSGPVKTDGVEHIGAQSENGNNAEKEKPSSMVKHEKPRKKGLFNKIGDVFDQ